MTLIIQRIFDWCRKKAGRFQLHSQNFVHHFYEIVLNYKNKKKLSIFHHISSSSESSIAIAFGVPLITCKTEL